MIIKRNDGETIIEDYIDASCVNMRCVISKSGSDNADANFELDIEEGGQVFTGCKLKVVGPLERAVLLPFLEQIVHEIKLLDNK